MDLAATAEREQLWKIILAGMKGCVCCLGLLVGGERLIKQASDLPVEQTQDMKETAGSPVYIVFVQQAESVGFHPFT